mmetsp:Transcript_30698/g.27893  ORF Transcript_30698/g.27893 Transcript_30698/m.27893 type:complete len:91 (-) Transcript_30698:865-1137(-)
MNEHLKEGLEFFLDILNGSHYASTTNSPNVIPFNNLLSILMALKVKDLLTSLIIDCSNFQRNRKNVIRLTHSFHERDPQAAVLLDTTLQD